MRVVEGPKQYNGTRAGVLSQCLRCRRSEREQVGLGRRSVYSGSNGDIHVGGFHPTLVVFEEATLVVSCWYLSYFMR